jgi:uncharacterized protein (TIGR02246 family)
MLFELGIQHDNVIGGPPPGADASNNTESIEHCLLRLRCGSSTDWMPLEGRTMTDDERAIRKLVDTWMEASRRGDTETVLSLMTDDIVFMTPGREPFGKEEFQKQSAALSDVKMNGRAEVREICVFGDWAWVRNHIDLTVTPSDGEPARRSGYTLSILQKGSDGLWRLARDANLVT